MQTILLFLAVAGIAWSLTTIIVCAARLIHGGKRWNI